MEVLLGAFLAGMGLMYVLVRLGRWWKAHVTKPRVHELSGPELSALLEAAAERRTHERKISRKQAVQGVRQADHYDSEPAHAKVDPGGA